MKKTFKNLTDPKLSLVFSKEMLKIHRSKLYVYFNQAERHCGELPSSLTWTSLSPLFHSIPSSESFEPKKNDSLTKQPFLATYRKIVSVGTSNEREIFPCLRVDAERLVWESKTGIGEEKRKWGGGGWFSGNKLSNWENYCRFEAENAGTHVETWRLLSNTVYENGS